MTIIEAARNLDAAAFKAGESYASYLEMATTRRELFKQYQADFAAYEAAARDYRLACAAESK